MFRVHHFAKVFSLAVRKNDVRFASFLQMKQAIKDLLGMDSERLPYEHVCQVGDPVLRNRAMMIEPDIIKMADFQKIIKQLTRVMRSYGACGLSGPQIGLPWQIFAIEYTKDHMKTSHEVVRKAYEESIIPLTIFINPELKVLDYSTVTCYETCESVRGYCAVVPRAYEVEVTALNASAEQFTWRACGWSARIAQHEYDHLQGKLYIDKMDMNTFHCTSWEKINKQGGKVQLSYWPRM